MSLSLTRDSKHEETLNPWARNTLEHGTFPDCKSAAVQLKLELQKLSESHKVVAQRRSPSVLHCTTPAYKNRTMGCPVAWALLTLFGRNHIALMGKLLPRYYKVTGNWTCSSNTCWSKQLNGRWDKPQCEISGIHRVDGAWFFWDVTQRNIPEERIPNVFAYFSSSKAQAFTYPIPPGAHVKNPSSVISIVKLTIWVNVSNLFYWSNILHVSEVFLSSSGVQNCKYCNRHMSNRYCRLLASGNEMELDGKTVRNV